MGNPTEELRAKLNELGIAWFAIAESATEYTKEGVVYRAYEFCGGMQVAIVTPVTPEQAIAATVGAGTCKRVYHPNRITKTCTCSNCGYGASDERWAYCPKCGHKYVHGEVEELWKRAGRKVAE